MDLVALQYFQFVAMYRNFSRAAEHFYVGQPTLSRQIANLERDLGVKLLNRDTRNVSLTDAGRVLYEQADLLLRHHDVIAQAIAATKKGHAGQLGIATILNFGPACSAIVKEFAEKYPDVHVRVDDIPFSELGDAIVHGIYDAAFTLDYTVPQDDALVATPVLKDSFVVIYSDGYRGELGDAITGDELLDQTLLIPNHVHPPFVRQIQLAARDRPSDGQGSVEFVVNTESALLRARLGMGVTVVPRVMVKTLSGFDNYRYCELVGVDTSYCLVAIHRRDNQSETLKRFLEMMPKPTR